MTCRICNSENLYPFLSLGNMPIPNGFLKEPSENEEFYPLEIGVCRECWLVQLTHIVPAEIMFKNYLYIPSTSSTMLKHFKSLAEDTVMRFRLDSNDLVVDIGSNDGTLLNYFKQEGVKVLGVDPASNLVKEANLKGIETKEAYFTKEFAKEIRKEKGRAKVITATNVLAHIDDLHNLCDGIIELMDPKGTFICEFPYFLDLLDKNEFDTIYHEHLSYFSIIPLDRLFAEHGLAIYDIKRIPVHGGSIRIYVGFPIVTFSNKYLDFYEAEEARGLNDLLIYNSFGKRVRKIRKELKDCLKEIKAEGKRIVGYGASAKGNVLLNYCGVGTETLDYIVDSIPYKQGKYTPGTHIPIYPESRLLKDQPDYALLLAWNFADEILKKQAKYREKGGQFIITIPCLRIE